MNVTSPPTSSCWCKWGVESRTGAVTVVSRWILGLAFASNWSKNAIVSRLDLHNSISPSPHSKGQAALTEGKSLPLVVHGSGRLNVPGGPKLKARRSVRLFPGNVARCPPPRLLEFAIFRKLAGRNGGSYRRRPKPNIVDLARPKSQRKTWPKLR